MGKNFRGELGMMNIQPGGQGRKRRSTSKSTEPKESGRAAVCGLISSVINAALVILVIGAFLHTYIKLDQEINITSAEIRRVDEKIASAERDLEGLKGRYARCSSRQFIRQQIARFKLPLEQIRYDQQQVIRVFSNEQLARMRFPVMPPRREVAVDNRRPARNIKR